jgi:hypothetical protein
LSACGNDSLSNFSLSSLSKRTRYRAKNGAISYIGFGVLVPAFFVCAPLQKVAAFLEDRGIKTVNS